MRIQGREQCRSTCGATHALTEVTLVALQVLELSETHMYEMNGVNLSTALHRIAKASREHGCALI